MKTVKRIALVMVIVMMASPALAASDALTFGIVDMNKVMQTTDAAKDILGQLGDKRKEYQSQISKEEDALRSAEQEIVKQKDSLSKDEFEKKRQGFEEKIGKGQKLVQSRKRILDQAFSSSMGNLRSEAAKIIADVAKEKNYSAVFTQDAVMMSTPELDMTAVVIERMNKNVKKIAVDWKALSAEADEASAKGAKKK